MYKRQVQECLTNITKHSSARQVTIKIESQDKFLSVLVKDDGQGFDQSQISEGFGLSGMRERVEGLGGSFVISAQLGLGVSIKVSLPVNIKVVS